MVRHQFPELQGLKAFLQSRKTEGLAVWPTVILHVQQHQELRPDIEGPYSLFLNLKGSSRVAAEGQWTVLKDDSYLLTNQQQNYSLLLDSNKEPTETFNIHFGDAFTQEALHSLLLNEQQLLDNPEIHTPLSFQFSNRSHYRDTQFNQYIERLRQHSVCYAPNHFEEDLYALFSYLCRKQQKEHRALLGIGVQKKSTRKELELRLNKAVNLMHEAYASSLSLDMLASTACLSKFHFLRLFKQVFGVSPNHYLQQVRLARTHTLLTQTSLSLADIANQVGLQNASSLSRLVSQHTGKAPSQLRG